MNKFIEENGKTIIYLMATIFFTINFVYILGVIGTLFFALGVITDINILIIGLCCAYLMEDYTFYIIDQHKDVIEAILENNRGR